MEVSELDIAIEELETRVERLRALYEQYFMGIEKIPPHVVQKDVDRRLYVLRRAQIRNTAKRFKLQTIIQRYNTFQQYWMRILREIENGTYRPHVLRAEKTVGITNLLTAAERKRLGLPEQEAQQSSATEAGPAESAPSGSSKHPDLPDGASFDSLAPPEHVQSAASVRAQIERDLGLMLDEDLEELPQVGRLDIAKELDDPLLSSLPPGPRKRKPSLRAPTRRTPVPLSEKEIPSSRRSSIRPHRVITIEPQPTAGARGTPPTAPVGEAHPATAGKPDALGARPIASPPHSQPGGGSPPFGSSPAVRPRLPVQSAVGGRGLPPPQSAVGGRGLPPPQSAVGGRGLPPAPRRPESPGTPVEARQPAPSHPGNATKAGSGPPPKGLPDIRDSVIPRSNPYPAPRAEPTRPMFERPAPPARTASSPQASGTIDRTNLERIARKLTEARKQTNEQTNVTLDALSKKLEATTAELQKKHVGRRIDFDVVIKDGKAIVKPIVR